MGEHSSHQAARYMRRGVHNGPGVHPIKHAFAEWHIAPVARKTPIFRPMSRTFKLPAGVTRWFHPFEKLQRDVSSSRYSWKSFPPFPNRNSPTNRNCCKRVTVEIACSSSWIKGRERERERGKKKKKKNTSDTRRSNWRITILGVLFDQSIDIENSFYYEVSRAKEIFSPYLMIYLFSSHFTNDKRLWKGKSDVLC